ncbi:MAG: hypothetical protein FWG47_08445 [Propionibacteriaceae bacterium]|nr:hypothetical protein [Propionibacteriaceae bacterium]
MPDMTCQEVDLDNLTLKPEQVQLAEIASGSKLLTAVAVDAGLHYRIIAAQLAKPTSPDGTDKVAWIHRIPNDEWLEVVPGYWLGGGAPDGKTVIWGPAARAAAMACLPKPEPPAICQDADLRQLAFEQGQDGTISAYDSKIIDSVEVNAGRGYRIIAVRLAEPTSPDGTDIAAWIRHVDSDSWLMPISPKWDGRVFVSEAALKWGLEAYTAAIACLG